MTAASRFIACCILVLAVTGCATTPPLTDDLPPDAVIPEYERWQFRGRVSMQRNEEGWHAGVNWQESAGIFTLKLSGPLGQGAVEVTGKEGLVRLQAANGKIIIANDADALLADVTGWQFPVSGIRYWVRGLPAPEPHPQAVITRDETGRLQRLVQSGWEIDYSRFEIIDGWRWPTRLRLAADDLVVRLVIDEWVLPVAAKDAASRP